MSMKHNREMSPYNTAGVKAMFGVQTKDVVFISGEKNTQEKVTAYDGFEAGIASLFAKLSPSSKASSKRYDSYGCE